ncbi:MAG TPA: DUF3303 family protein [Chitinophagaceae bacterium]|nr:DUF3303 family protein [Chitinophagaceae bacterium]MCB9054996.1 DUF3303 family protein [Chitinophagales bacterium]HPG10066.1 DUF3303 family protein [Chitinophagaceae bacterium]
MKQYIIIERFHEGKGKALYQRFDERGRMLPQGVYYINSWINESVSVCYQLMEAESPELLQLWVDQWNDLSDFEVVPVISSGEAQRKIAETG